MAVTVAQVQKRSDGNVVKVPVAATIKILGGTLVFLDATGFATDVKVDATTVFCGIARDTADNTSGADGDLSVEVLTEGTFDLVCSSLTQADLNVAIHATDNFTTTKTTTANPKVGVLQEFVSATVGRVAVAGLGRAAD